MHDWDNKGEHFIGVKVIANHNTLFGWIRVAVDSTDKITVIDYACNKNPSISYADIYPNPADAQLTILFSSDEYQTLKIYSVTGALVNEISFSPANQQYILNTEALDAGLYVLAIESPSGNERRKFVVKHNKK